MQKDRSFSGLLLAGALAAVVTAAVIGWFLAAPTAGGSATLPGTVHAVKQRDSAPASPGSSASSPTPSPLSSVPLPAGASIPADHAVAAILAENPTVDAARDKLLETFPGLSEREQIAATPHLVNLVTDEHLQKLSNLLQRTETPTKVKEVIFDNMLNRPPELGWPVLLGVMSIPGHPLAQRARETLTIIVGANHEDRLHDWQNALAAQLKFQGR